MTPHPDSEDALELRTIELFKEYDSYAG